MASSPVKKCPAKGKNKKKVPKDVNAPHKPLNPYVLFLNKTRDSVRSAHPESSFTEVAKLLSAKWTSLDESEKKQYFDAAAKDRERYRAEYSVYRTTENYRKFQECKKSGKFDVIEKHVKKSKDERHKNVKKHKSRKKKDRKRSFSPLPPYEFKVKKNSKSSHNDADAKPTIDSSDIPIFTEAFLDHNKLQEGELRRLRKQTMDYEEANAILSKHIDNVSATGNKVSDEITLMTEKNKLIIQHLNHLNQSLLTLFTNNSFTLVDSFISNNNNGSPLTVESMENLINFIDNKLTSAYNNTSSNSSASDKENCLLREKLKKLLEDLCKKDNETCIDIKQSQ